MFSGVIQALFLYFPEDKSEYVPAVITTAIFMIGALLAMRFFILRSRKEEMKAKQVEETLFQSDRK